MGSSLENQIDALQAVLDGHSERLVKAEEENDQLSKELIDAQTASAEAKAQAAQAKQKMGEMLSLTAWVGNGPDGKSNPIRSKIEIFADLVLMMGPLLNSKHGGSK